MSDFPANADDDDEPEGVDGDTVDQQRAARRTPTASVVSRALRRDVGIITQPRNRIGYHVSSGYGEPSIVVNVKEGASANLRAAIDLADTLTAYGWDIRRADAACILYVLHVPSTRAAAVRKASVARKAALEGANL